LYFAIVEFVSVSWLLSGLAWYEFEEHPAWATRFSIQMVYVVSYPGRTQFVTLTLVPSKPPLTVVAMVVVPEEAVG
jgi:hypothetical protein